MSQTMIENAIPRTVMGGGGRAIFGAVFGVSYQTIGLIGDPLTSDQYWFGA